MAKTIKSALAPEKKSVNIFVYNQFFNNLKGVSAREMSLSIGQNASYINNIESGKSLPSMSGFFYICEYLGISPNEFFDTDSKNPEKLQALINDLKHLDDAQLDNISSIVKGLIK